MGAAQRTLGLTARVSTVSPLHSESTVMVVGFSVDDEAMTPRPENLPESAHARGFSDCLRVGVEPRCSDVNAVQRNRDGPPALRPPSEQGGPRCFRSDDPFAYRSNRSRFITLSHAATKSLTNFLLASSLAYTSARARS